MMLRDFLAGRPMGLDRFFPLAIELATALGEVHARGERYAVLHPGSVSIDPDDASTRLLPSPSGSLAYQAPEETGRTNRRPDHRSDLYSLGVVFYECLAGRHPFPTRDAAELIHAHIARNPAPLSDLDPKVPPALAAVVGKLLAKMMEERYQTAEGLLADLEHCRDDWRNGGTIAPFTPGEHDLADSLLAPVRIVGREAERGVLERALERAGAGDPSLLLVGGHSGVGKTAFIRELVVPIARRRAYFAAGKFDEVLRAIPFRALAQALRTLLQQILTEGETRLAVWRAQLEEALGPAAAVLEDLIPELEHVLGPLAPVPALGAVEEGVRFREVFTRLVATLARDDHPLAIFLDDLQWADPATLELLQMLLLTPSIRHLLVVGAYRDNEVGEDHPLSAAIANLGGAGVRVERLTLEPLSRRDLGALLAEILHDDEDEVAPLARLVHQKTGGNPFFAIQFLGTLRRGALLRLDRQSRRWVYDLAQVQQAKITDDVAELMVGKMELLERPARRVLSLAACIGNRFDTEVLAAIGALSPAAVVEALAEPLEEGLIVPGYAFAHDRVRLAAYALLPVEERPAVHVAIGRFLREQGVAHGGDALFEIVEHLNLGHALLREESERVDLARLDLAAAQRARAGTAREAALGYCRTALLLLDERWDRHADLLLDLHLLAAECGALLGRPGDADEHLGRLLARPLEPRQRARVHSLRMMRFAITARYDEAIDEGCRALALFGIGIPPTAGERVAMALADFNAIDQILEERGGLRSVLALEESTDPDAAVVTNLLYHLSAPAILVGEAGLALFAGARIVRLTLEQGFVPESGFGFSHHGHNLVLARRRYREGFDFGLLGVELLERPDTHHLRARTHMEFSMWLSPWRMPWLDCATRCRRARDIAIEGGDLLSQAWSEFWENAFRFLAGRDLREFLRHCDAAIEGERRLPNPANADLLRLLSAWGKALAGQTASPTSLDHAEFSESQWSASYGEVAHLADVLHLARLHLGLIHGDGHVVSTALAGLRGARLPLRGSALEPLVDFLEGFSLAVACDSAEGKRRTQLLEKLTRRRRRLASLARLCPENFRCLSLLLDGEQQRLEGHLEAAAVSHQDAIRVAAELGSNWHLGIAHELAARVAARAGDEAGAGSHLQQAHAAWTAWGARAVAASLEQRHPGIARSTLAQSRDSLERQSVVADLTALSKAAQAIAAETHASTLLEKLLRLSMENAGADRGLVVRDENGELRIVAAGNTESADAAASRPLDSEAGAIAGVVRYVQATRRPLVIGDLRADDRFARGEGFASSGPRAVLCVPVLHQGELAEILYLENSLAADAFTPARVRLLDMIASQAAVALQNARLYDRMRQTQADLRTALDEVETLKNRLQAENVYLQEEIRREHNFAEMVGSSDALLAVLRKIEMVARTDSTVLIWGETGTGKELIARAIHDRSGRSRRPLVKVNCAAISAGLVESELFGHAKGAFTGALERRIGRFELADGGTIFLHEVGELPLETQVKLLRVLQEHEFEPVGSNRTVSVDVRLIAATNRDLQAEVAAGRFRADLFYRLNVFPLEVPPLRQRGGDIAALTLAFVARFAKQFGRPEPAVSEETMERLLAYPWPGNVRELQNVIERAVVLCSGNLLSIDPSVVPPVPVARPAATDQPTSAAPDAAASLQEVQRQHIAAVLEQTGGVIEGPNGAARLLGVQPNTLRYRMKKLGLRR